ncbi:hypothetical protein CerSpe_239640 [Prunus speciosa]
MAAATEDIFTKLDHLSLLSKVVLELETHTGLGDIVLAEFITDLGRSCETVDEFNSKLQENDAQMADYFVCTLFTIIHAIRRPKPPKPEKVSKKDSVFEPVKENRNCREVDEEDRRGGRRDRYRDSERDRHETRRSDEDRERRRHADLGNQRNRDGCELYTVHKGRVARVVYNGCFVQLNDQGGREGGFGSCFTDFESENS